MPERITKSLPKLTYWTSAIHLDRSTRRGGHTMHPTKMSTDSLCKVSISVLQTHSWSMMPSRNLPIPPKFDSDSNLTDRKDNPRETANLGKDHHQKRCTRPIFRGPDPFFDRQPPPESSPIDAEFNSAPNPCSISANPSGIANPEKKSRIWC